MMPGSRGRLATGKLPEKAVAALFLWPIASSPVGHSGPWNPSGRRRIYTVCVRLPRYQR
jgi:hypothetical protein